MIGRDHPVAGDGPRSGIEAGVPAVQRPRKVAVAAVEGHVRRQVPRRYPSERWEDLAGGMVPDDALGLARLEAGRFRLRTYRAGEVICRQGDPNTHMFNLVSGWVELRRDIADGRSQITQFLQDGAYFGIEPDGEDLSQSATAITDAVVWPIGTSRFHELRRSIPSLNEQFTTLLLNSRRDMVTVLTRLGLGSAKERIVGLLWSLGVATVGAGAMTQVGGAVPMPLTQRHIASATGLTSIHVNRVLRELREAQVMDLRDGMLRVLNGRKFRAIAEPGQVWPALPARDLRDAESGGWSATPIAGGSWAR
jgi:CRP-like cAMP-binding protein